MQRACAVGVVSFVVQGALQALLAPQLYPAWWWTLVAPTVLAASLGLVGVCAAARMRTLWALVTAVPASVCFALTSVATAGSVLVDTTAVGTISIGMACAIGFLQPPRWALPVGLLMIGSLAVSMALTRGFIHADLVGVTVIGTAVLCLGVVQSALSRRTTSAIDDAVGRVERALIADRAATAARADRRELERRMHDTVLNTLTALGRGGLSDTPVLRARCAADAEFLRALRRTPDGPADPTDLLTGLREVASRTSDAGFTVTVTGATSDDPDPAIVSALVAAAHEAATNSRRHSHASAASITVAGRDGRFEVTVLDHGRGVDLDAARGRLGVRRSIMDRMTDVGGGAEVGPADGGGTRVRLWWPR